jgi:putative addiction module CopG family antidote
MTVHLPEDLERYVLSEVQHGRFASADEAVCEAVRLLRQQHQSQNAPAQQLTEQEFEQKLVRAGFLALRPAGDAGKPTLPRLEPVRIQGEALSETIIRERR